MAENIESIENTPKINEDLEINENVCESANFIPLSGSTDSKDIQDQNLEDKDIAKMIESVFNEKAAKSDNNKEEISTIQMDVVDATVLKPKNDVNQLDEDDSLSKNDEKVQVDEFSQKDDNIGESATAIEKSDTAISPEITAKDSDEHVTGIIDSSSNNEQNSKIIEETAEFSNENEVSQQDQKENFNSEGSSALKRKLSDTPEDILNLLKTLSPEKLLEIKSKVLEITDQKVSATTSEIAPKESKLESNSTENIEESSIEKEQTNDEITNSDVICLDSDDEENSQAKSVESQEENPMIQEHVNENTGKDNHSEKSMEVDGHSNLNGDSSRINLKECINPKCPRNKDDEYLESPSFILSMYYISRKPNKIQWVCSTCHNEAVDIYEQLSSKFLNNEPWMKVKIPKKQDLVEIIDSDEEDQSNETKSESEQKDDSNLITFTEEVEMEVEEILNDFISKIDIKMQLNEEYKFIDSKVDKNGKILSDMSEELNALERKSYKMYDELYSFNRPKIQRRPSLSLDIELSPESNNAHNSTNRISQSSEKPDVSILPITRSSTGSILPNSTKTTGAPGLDLQNTDRFCYALRQRGTQIPHWMPCRIIEEISVPEGKKFKVQFNDNTPNSLTVLSGREVSVSTYSDKLQIGARVIALFPRAIARNKDQTSMQLKRFLPGVIGEKLTQYNKMRYLVFCDYGQVRYCAPNEVREIQEISENVWDDVHPNLRQFIRDYLESKTNRSRALLNVRVNTQIMTERAGNWRKAVVQEVDCSLVKVYFTEEHVSEWLYRGSKRLYTMYQQTQRVQGNAFQRRNDPGTFSYITIDEDDSNSGEAASSEAKRNIAKKSTSKHPQALQQAQQQQAQQLLQAQQAAGQAPIILNDRNIYLEEPVVVGKVRHFTPKAGICAKKFVKHDCTSGCITPSKNDLSSFSPLSKPLLSCWERQIVKQRNYRYVVYKAPCGRRLRDMHEVFIYLGLTKCTLNVDNFDFDPSIQVLASFQVDKSLCPLFIDDIAEGKEGMKIACINAFDQQRPPPLVYSANRIPMSGVNINTDPEFMSCCDCTDECFDKSKCACFQLTIRGAKYKNLMEEDEENISYLWKRLLSAVPTGIYECNSRCKCSDRCLNKVVQQPVRTKMQLYRTKARGWGLQSLHDIPKGTFICIYAGNLYTEKDANALCQGLDHGDEYFAELDLIENAENRKEGYESGVINPDESEEEKDSDSDYDDRNDSHDYDDGDFVSKTKATSQREIVTRSSRTSSATDKNKDKKSSASSTPQRTNSEDSSDDEMVNMIPNTNSTGNLGYPEGMRIPFRKLYGPKERVYIMDAKRCGNVGRYFNHSCDPNLFVQCVFVDTHDLRFPWIAFFAARPIKAGEELTWNYNYEVGSVPSKVLYCKCGSKNCRGRIL